MLLKTSLVVALMATVNNDSTGNNLVCAVKLQKAGVILDKDVPAPKLMQQPAQGYAAAPKLMRQPAGGYRPGVEVSAPGRRCSFHRDYQTIDSRQICADIEDVTKEKADISTKTTSESPSKKLPEMLTRQIGSESELDNLDDFGEIMVRDIEYENRLGALQKRSPAAFQIVRKVEELLSEIFPSTVVTDRFDPRVKKAVHFPDNLAAFDRVEFEKKSEVFLRQLKESIACPALLKKQQKTNTKRVIFNSNIGTTSTKSMLNSSICLKNEASLKSVLEAAAIFEELIFSHREMATMIDNKMKKQGSERDQLRVQMHRALKDTDDDDCAPESVVDPESMVDKFYKIERLDASIEERKMKKRADSNDFEFSISKLQILEQKMSLCEKWATMRKNEDLAASFDKPETVSSQLRGSSFRKSEDRFALFTNWLIPAVPN